MLVHLHSKSNWISIQRCVNVEMRFIFQQQQKKNMPFKSAQHFFALVSFYRRAAYLMCVIKLFLFAVLQSALGKKKKTPATQTDGIEARRRALYCTVLGAIDDCRRRKDWISLGFQFILFSCISYSSAT